MAILRFVVRLLEMCRGLGRIRAACPSTQRAPVLAAAKDVPNMKTRVLTAVALAIALTLCAHAQVPGIINYQGRIVDNGTNFNGTGLFGFALVNPGGTTNYWSNDGTSAGQPALTVSLTVTKGLYSVLLGDTTVSNMTVAIPSAVFTNANVLLRVWFNDGVNGVQQLSPDQRIAAVGYALMAGGVPDSSITAAKIATGAVGSNQIAAGSIGSAAIATGAVTAASISSGQVVKSVNGLTDAVTLSAGSNITVTPIGNGFQIAASGGGVTSASVSSGLSSNGISASVSGGLLMLGGVVSNLAAGGAFVAIGTNSPPSAPTINTYSPYDVDLYWNINAPVVNSGNYVVWQNLVDGDKIEFGANAELGMELRMLIGNPVYGAQVIWSMFHTAGSSPGIDANEYQNFKSFAIHLGAPQGASGSFSYDGFLGNVIIDEGTASLTETYHEVGVDTNHLGFYIMAAPVSLAANISNTNASENTHLYGQGVSVPDLAAWDSIGSNQLAMLDFRQLVMASNSVTTGLAYTNGTNIGNQWRIDHAAARAYFPPINGSYSNLIGRWLRNETNGIEFEYVSTNSPYTEQVVTSTNLPPYDSFRPLANLPVSNGANVIGGFNFPDTNYVVLISSDFLNAAPYWSNKTPTNITITVAGTGHIDLILKEP
jgi:hypothetical protein